MKYKKHKDYVGCKTNKLEIISYKSKTKNLFLLKLKNTFLSKKSSKIH